MTHKIAIIKGRNINCYDDYGDSYKKIVDSITDWEEVTDEEFKTLTFAANRLDYTLLEQPIGVKAFVTKTIADYKAVAAAEEKKAAAEKAKREQAALDKKWKKELKTKEDKVKLLRKLQEELGEEVKS